MTTKEQFKITNQKRFGITVYDSEGKGIFLAPRKTAIVDVAPYDISGIIVEKLDSKGEVKEKYSRNVAEKKIEDDIEAKNEKNGNYKIAERFQQKEVNE